MSGHGLTLKYNGTPLLDSDRATFFSPGSSSCRLLESTAIRASEHSNPDGPFTLDVRREADIMQLTLSSAAGEAATLQLSICEWVRAFTGRGKMKTLSASCLLAPTDSMSQKVMLEVSRNTSNQISRYSKDLQAKFEEKCVTMSEEDARNIFNSLAKIATKKMMFNLPERSMG